ncbi:hypothetical protein BT69DRAFT_1276629 [Atractiella rhizophila]|nr:hypothetical protein BT69DRAFT_1276629 [Atractiella rhizophila]
MKKSSKRKNQESDEEQVAEGETVDVSFTFTQPHTLDFQSIKHLLTQLLADTISDESFPYNELADLIIAQKDVGNFVRVADSEEDDGEGEGGKEEEAEDDAKEAEKEEEPYPGDAYGFLTLLDLDEHGTKPALQTLLTTLASSCPHSNPLHQILSSPPSSTALILGERVVNMPLDLVPHLYRLLAQDLLSGNKKYKSYIFLSRVFVPTNDHELSFTGTSTNNEGEDNKNEGEMPPKKKKKKSKSNSNSGGRGDVVKDEDMFPYHPETVFVASLASSSFTTPVKLAPKHEDGLASIPGVENALRVMCVPGEKWEELVEGVGGFMSG